jgi:hypothetical protein
LPIPIDSEEKKMMEEKKVKVLTVRDDLLLFRIYNDRCAAQEKPSLSSTWSLRPSNYDDDYWGV